MASQSTSVQWSVVPPDAQTQKIGNILDAPRILADKIENLQQEIVTAEAAFYESLAKDLAAAPQKVEKAIEDYIALKAKIAALAAKIQAGEELGPIIKKLIQELKTTQAETLKAVIRRKLVHPGRHSESGWTRRGNAMFDQTRNHGRWNDFSQPFTFTVPGTGAQGTVRICRVSNKPGWILADAVRVLKRIRTIFM